MIPDSMQLKSRPCTQFDCTVYCCCCCCYSACLYSYYEYQFIIYYTTLSTGTCSSSSCLLAVLVIGWILFAIAMIVCISLLVWIIMINRCSGKKTKYVIIDSHLHAMQLSVVFFISHVMLLTISGHHHQPKLLSYI